jgi:hypothetical protein
LTAELVKLSAADGDVHAALAVVIENALTRFAAAILAQANQTQEKSLEEALPV